MAKPLAIKWYKTPIARETLKGLTGRSNLLGLLQTLGYLGFLGITGFFSIWSVGKIPVAVSILLFFTHGTFWAFMLNGFHELSHNTVFRSKWLNGFFLRLFSFLSWNNFVFFQASHREHHCYTLHPPEDLEVLLPIKLTLGDFLLRALVNPIGLLETLFGTIRLSLGIVHGNLPSGLAAFKGEWMRHLFPPEKKKERRGLVNWARLTLLGHAAITVVAIYFGYWTIPIVISAASFYGSWLLYFCNHTQHIGLKDNVPDFRLNSRTFLLNPFLQFFYWHMNYHIEHHMYAAVPCYRLGKLHRVIAPDTPTPTRGLISTWKQILGIMKKQKVDPYYQYDALAAV